jgi:serine/threonine-protein kinase
VDESAFGRYRLMTVVGRDGMGTLYRAQDTEMGREVALKVLSPELAAVAGYRERFERETQTAARLGEPHILPIIEVGEIGGLLYLVMPVIDGIDVAGLLQREGPLAPARAVAVIEQLAAALAAAHGAGLVHRDVQPANALITPAGFVYLTGFGVAHDSAATRSTRAGSIVGGWAYMAPERFGTGGADARTDVYALACVLHECVTGQPPFPGEGLQHQMAGHLGEPPPRPSLLNPAVPAGLDEVIAVGMAKDPAQRYQTAPQLAAAARQALTATPAPWSAEPPQAPALEALPAQPATRLEGPVGPAIPPGHPGPGWPPAPGRPAAMEGPRPSRTPWLLGAGAAAAVLIIAVVAVVMSPGPGPKPAPNPQTPPPAPMVAPAGLDPILATAADVNTIMGASGMQPDAPITHAPKTTPDTLSNPDCLGTFFAAQPPAYQGSGYTAMSFEQLREPGNSPVHVVGQAAVSFPSTDLASAFVQTSAGKWRACAGQNITLTENGQSYRWAFANLVGDVPAITLLRTAEGYNGWACQHALRAVVNVVLDVSACSQQISDQAGRIADKMAATATQQAH